MKKSWIILLGLIISLLSVICVSAEVRINEVMHHTNNSFGFEWVELYNSNNENMSLINWKIGDLTTSNKNFSLNISANGFGIIIGSGKENCLLFNIPLKSCCALSQIGSGLNDGPEEVFIYNESSFLINNMSYNKNLKPFGKSFQFCSGNWLERNPTPASQNNCSTSQSNPTQNNTQNPIQENNSNPKASISIDWNDDEIINGDEFDIEVNAKNLKNQKYNFKIWIKDDEENIISDRYGEDSSEKEVWKSGNYYIYNLFEGPGNKTETIKLKIRKGFSDFSGDAEICFKLENQKCEAIEVLKKEAVVNKNNTEKIKIISKASESTNSISGDVIKLGSSKSKETITNNQKNTNSSVVYESKNEKIKIYAIISFAVLCLGLVILVLFNKLN